MFSNNENKNEPIIGIDLGTTFSCVAIMRNENVEIVPDNKTGEKLIPSIVCFKSNSDCLIGKIAKNNMIEFSQSTMFDNKRLLGYKFNDKHVQEDIKNWPVKIIEDKNTGKPKYVIKVENEEKEYFPENVASMILSFLKKNAEIYENKEIKKAVIGVPSHFNTLQRKATIEAAEEAGFEDIKLINEPTAAAIAYGDIWKSDKERNVLIFDLGGGTFDVSIVKIKGIDYYVLASLGEEHLGGEDFNQRLFLYVFNRMKNDNKFKDIDINNKNKTKLINLLKRLNQKTEEVKKELSNSFISSFYIDGLYNGNDLDLEISRQKYEELCMDLWEKCLIKVDEAIKLAKLKKEDIDEIILVGGSTRTPKIKEMVKNYFNGKEPLQNVNPDEVVAYGAALVPYLDLKIQDIISKPIGIIINQGKMCNIIPVGTPLPLKGAKILNFSREFTLSKNVDSNTQIISIYEGENEKALENHFLGKFVVTLKENEKNKVIRITMNIDYNNILNVTAKVEDEKKNEIGIRMIYNE